MNELIKKFTVGFVSLAMVAALVPVIPVEATLTPAELQAQIAALTAQLAQLQAQLQALQPAPVTPAVPACEFVRNLRVGLRGDDVRCLQEYLIGAGHAIPAGATGFFGPQTRAAVIAWQTANNITPAAGFFGPLSRAKYTELAAIPVTPPTPPTLPLEPVVPVIPAGLNVGLAADTPAIGTIIAGQAIAELARFTFTNGDAAEVKVTRLVLTRTGVSADATLSAVYLYDGARRITELASVSAGKITFINAAGIFSVPAGGSRIISVRSDIATGSAGQTVGVQILAAADVETGATALGGTFPLSGNLMSVATAALPTVVVASTGISPVVNLPAGSTDYTVWQNNLTIGVRAVDLAALQLRQIGSVRTDDIRNFRLFVGGTQRATAVLAADNTLTFDLTASPVRLAAGTALVEVRADVVSGSGRTFSFALWRATDLDVRDSEFRVNLLPTGTIPASAPTTGTHSIGTGTLTVVRAADSPIHPVVVNGIDVPLARYTLSAFGESVRVERLRVDGPTSAGNSTTLTLRNGRLLANGVQVGSVAGIVTDTGTTYELGGALVVVPGSPVTLEVRADIFDSEGANELASAGPSIRLRLAALTNNAQTLESLTLLNIGGDTEGNALTVAAGALVVASNAAFGNQNVVAGTTNVRIGSFVLQTGPAETINISNYRVGIGGTASLANLANLRISESTLVRGAVTATNDFSVTQTLAANTTRIVDVFADIGTGVAATQTVTTTLAVTARGATTGTELPITTVSGQTMTAQVGTLGMVRDPGTPVSALVVGGTTVPVVRYRFDASNEAFTITEARVAIMQAADISAVTGLRIGAVTAPLVVAADSALAQTASGLTANAVIAAGTDIALANAARFKPGQRVNVVRGTVTLSNALLTCANGVTGTTGCATGTVDLDAALAADASTTATVTPINGTATFSGTVLTVPRDGNAIMTVEAVFNIVSTGLGTTGSTPIFSLTSYRAQSASGAVVGPILYGVSPLTVAAADSNPMTLRRTVPTVTLDTTALSNILGGADHEVLRVNIAANAAEDVDIREIRVTPTLSDPVTGGAGIAVFQGAVERGRVMHLGSVDANIPSLAIGTHTTIPLATTAEAERYQVGQRITVAGTNITTVTTVITGISGANLTVSPGVVVTTASSTAESITPAGYTTGNTYRISLTLPAPGAAVVPKGTSSVFSVRADTAGLAVSGRNIQVRILADTSAGVDGNLIWREGTATTNINGNLVRELPITGPILVR